MIVAVREDGTVVARGDSVTSFRGTKATFQYVSRVPSPGKSGKVTVLEDGREYEFYPSVFDLRLVQA